MSQPRAAALQGIADPVSRLVAAGVLVRGRRAIVAAVKAYASVGEITTRLVGVFGRYQEPLRFDHRDEPELAA